MPTQLDSGLLHPSRSTLLVVDVQTRLAPHIHEHESVVQRCCWLAGVARQVDVPIVLTEHYPQGLGPTVAKLRAQTGEPLVMRKDYFSCWADAAIRRELQSRDVDQVVVCGMEAHVCVMQSVLEMQASGLDLYLVADAVGSQRPLDRQLAIDRMRCAGATIVSAEMVLFEWARRGATPLFKSLHREFLAKT